MTWNELIRIELSRLHAQEEIAVATFEEMEAQAFGESTRALLRDAIDDGPSRLFRLEIVLSHLEEDEEGRPLRSFEGWREDVRNLRRGDPLGPVHDAAILALLLRMMRTRTSCYEVAHVLALGLGAETIANLLGALLATDLALDAEVASALARAVLEGEGRWELNELRA